MSTDFYNVFSARSRRLLKQISDCGHEIGLHFDEVKYESELEILFDDLEKVKRIKSYIQKEADLLSSAVGMQVTTVSMHRPSKLMLETDILIPGMVNSYAQTFFHEFKYVSDSRMHWREDVEAIVKSEDYEALHILTHPFWYSRKEETTRKKLLTFIDTAKSERYMAINENFRDLEEFVKEEEVR